MNITFLVTILQLIVITYFVIVYPLFLMKREPYLSSRRIGKDFKESVALLESITEINLDFKMGKLSPQDFEALSLEYQRNYLKAIENEDRLKSKRGKP